MVIYMYLKYTNCPLHTYTMSGNFVQHAPPLQRKENKNKNHDLRIGKI